MTFAGPDHDCVRCALSQAADHVPSCVEFAAHSRRHKSRHEWATVETVEFAVYFFGFWMFLFSPKFRQSWLDQGRSANAIGKAFMFL